MALTPNRGLEIPDGTDIVRLFATIDTVAKDNDAILDTWLRTGELELFTPDLLGTNSNPSYGSGAIRKGWFRRYQIDGTGIELIEGFFRIQFGSGASAGNGSYFTTMPTDVAAPHTASEAAGRGDVLGDWELRKVDSVPNSQNGVLLLRSSTANTCWFGVEHGIALVVLTSTSVAEGDRYSVNFSYIGEVP